MKKYSVLKVFTLVLLMFLCISAYNVNAAARVWHPSENWPIDATVNFDFSGSGNYTINGRTISGNKFVLSFNLDGQNKNVIMFCSDSMQANPMNSPIDKVVEKGKLMSPGDAGYNKRLALATYYGYNGGADLTANQGLTEVQRIAITAILCSYAKNYGSENVDTLAAGSSIVASIKSHIDNPDAAGEPNNIVYYYFGTYAVKELGDLAVYPSAPEGGPLCTDYQYLSAFYGYAPKGKVQLYKTLDKPEADYATVTGAEYTVYKDSGLTQKVGTLTTGADGKTNVIEVDVGTYYIKETKAPDGCLIDTKTYKVEVTSGNTSIVNSQEIVKYKIRVSKELIKINGNKGDAKLEGAVYNIYNNENCEGTPVASLTTDSNGQTPATDYITYGTYYIKEVTPPEGTELDSTVYKIEPNEASKDTDYIETFKASNEIIRTSLSIVKEEDNYDSSHEAPGAGAKLRLTLVSNNEEYYETVVDERGRASFEDIPYGKYELTEVEFENERYLDIDKVTLEMYVRQTDKVYHVITGEKEVRAFLRIVKIDSKENKVIPIEGAEFKIYSEELGKFITFDVYQQGTLESLVTNKDGIITTPEKLESGKYILYEVNAPKGYYLDPKYTIPQNPADVGNPEKGGIEVTIDRNQAFEMINDKDYVYEARVVEAPLFVDVTISKTGEKLTNSENRVKKYFDHENEEDVSEVITVPCFEQRGLQGVTYKITAEEDVYSPIGTLIHAKGETIEEITTNAEGVASSTVDIYPGKYRIEEIEVPLGYVLKAEPEIVELVNENQKIESQNSSFEYQDDRQKLAISFEKLFEETKYVTEKEQKYAVFGVYTKEAIKNDLGNEVISANTMVDLLISTDDEVVKTETSLAAGKYYVKEIYTAWPYTLSEDVAEFDVTYSDDNTQTEVIKSGHKFINKADASDIKFIKLSKLTKDSVILGASEIYTKNLDERAKQILEDLKEMTTDEEINKYLVENGLTFVPGAEYEIWINEEGTKKVLTKDENGKYVPLTLVTKANTGIMEEHNIPVGKYYLKEIKAPTGYKIEEKPIPFEVDKDKGSKIYQVVYDEDTKSEWIHKTDIYTGQEVPNCLFEITDESGKLIYRSRTDENGVAWIAARTLKDGQTYYYQEIDSPDVYKKFGEMYELNTEKHEFVAHVQNGVWTGEELIEVQNVRPSSFVKIIKTYDEGNRVPNCKFELKSVEDGLYYETGVTDENGIYVFENVPKGKYIYTELEAPEEYEIDTTPHEIEVTEEGLVIEFVNTGDIQVYVLGILALVSILGISYIVVRKRIIYSK